MKKMSEEGVKSPDAAAQEIQKLYQDLVDCYKNSLEKSLEIGKILWEQKKNLEHGQWLQWAQKLPFSERSARNYVSIYKHRDQLKSASVADLNTAYKYLAHFHNQKRHEKRNISKKYRKNFADQPSKFQNPQINGDYTNKIIAGDNGAVMSQMQKDGMNGKVTLCLTSPPYSAKFYYGENYPDNKPYEEYVSDILKPFPYYSQLLRPGGRVIYILGSMVKKDHREDGGDYNYQIIPDLMAGVKRVAPELRFFNHIIWDKGGSGRDPLNNSYGTYCSPQAPITRCCHEHILVWSNKEFELENIENTEPDITPDEFKEWSWSVWKVAPHSMANNPHPCSFPPKLIEQILKYYSYPNDLILDPYAGVAVTAQVCQKLGRRYTCIEQNPNYCEFASNLLKTA